MLIDHGDDDCDVSEDACEGEQDDDVEEAEATATGRAGGGGRTDGTISAISASSKSRLDDAMLAVSVVQEDLDSWVESAASRAGSEKFWSSVLTWLNTRMAAWQNLGRSPGPLFKMAESSASCTATASSTFTS